MYELGYCYRYRNSRSVDYFDEATILNFTHQYQQITDWHQKTPGADV